MFSKLIIRSLGLISTLVLVRLLDPDDFGLVAIGIMVIGLFRVLSDIGINRYLIMHSNPTDEDYSAAWSLNLITKTVLIVILVFCSPFIDYMATSSVVTGCGTYNTLYFDAPHAVSTTSSTHRQTPFSSQINIGSLASTST